MGLALAQVYANIPVKPHAMRCGDGLATCLSEAIPCDRNECIVGKRALGDLYPQSFRRSDIAIPKELQARAPVSTDATRAPAAPNTAIVETPTSTAALVASLVARRLHHQPVAVLTDQTVVAALPSSAERLVLGLHMEPVALHMATAVILTVTVVQAA
ncbi:MAG: hypothetical protein Q9198_006432 [Flavoplaca austrocitrina]